MRTSAAGPSRVQLEPRSQAPATAPSRSTRKAPAKASKKSQDKKPAPGLPTGQIHTIDTFASSSSSKVKEETNEDYVPKKVEKPVAQRAPRTSGPGQVLGTGASAVKKGKGKGKGKQSSPPAEDDLEAMRQKRLAALEARMSVEPEA